MTPGPAPISRGGRIGHALLAVGPGLVGSLHGPAGFAMNPLSLQPAKIHCPPARDDTLTRERLNSWLERAAAGRVALIVAEAGFGKTTLLADWARHSQRLTAWYRLEPDDRDWLTFIRHLVGSVRELDSEFAPMTYAMLEALGSGGPTPADLTLSISREMAEWGAATERGLTLIIDDYHLVDGFAETEPIVRALLERTGPGLSVVIASRSMPRLPLGKLRARGGVHTVDSAALRFDVLETGELFREAYQKPLDTEVVTELHVRTEGWPALLMLVNASLAEQEDPRRLVDGLKVSEGDIYDFLAEELLDALPVDLAHFLTRVAILEHVEPVSAHLATGIGTSECAAAMLDSERLGLLTRAPRAESGQFHPLVQQFLQSRLEGEIGPEAVALLHRHVAEGLPVDRWSERARHLLRAGDREGCQQTVDAALEQIVAAGEFTAAKRFLEPDAGDPNRPAALLLRSRIELMRGDFERAITLARRAVEQSVDGIDAGLYLHNLAATLSMWGVADEAAEVHARSLGVDLTPVQRHVAEASLALREASREGDLKELADFLGQLALEQERAGLRRYAGISRLNRCGSYLWLGDAEAALREALAAEGLLGGPTSDSIERVAATTMRAVALAQLGRLDLGRSTMPPQTGDAVRHLEVRIETTRMELEFGSLERATASLTPVSGHAFSRSHEGIISLLSAEIAFRQGDPKRAAQLVERLRITPCVDAAGLLREWLLRARVSLRHQPERAASEVAEAARIAEAQNSPRGVYLAGLLGRATSRASIDDLVAKAGAEYAFCWSLLAEEVSQRLDDLKADNLRRVAIEAGLRPERWRPALREAIEQSRSRVRAAELLAEIGDADDAIWLRSFAARSKELRPYAAAVSRRLARPLWLIDLGVVRVRTERDEPLVLRRKVLALLCFLSIRPGLAATREEVIDALWPDLGPDAGTNSLHQAIYSLRRAIDPAFKEGLSASYVDVDGEVVRLNSDLVDSASRLCWRKLDLARQGDLTAWEVVAEIYQDRYALTFAYESWAEAYRETLHAAVLGAAEKSMGVLMERGDDEGAVRIAHAILAIDPHADAIELQLLRTYKRSGRAAAAAEQYAHYASTLKQDLGADPPPFDEL